MRISSDDIDTTSVDAALGTTRAVRFRLDLERDVDQQIILDCIEVAEQAPSGGNQGSRRWLVIRDDALKAALAELYMKTAGKWMVDARDSLAGTGHHNERVMASAAHLAEHLAEVPAIVIPTIIGRHDNSGRPGLFDSVIQSAWSFSVALRARGLGSAWTTAIFNAEDEIAELLDIPPEMTQIAMLPVAWTKGTEFSTAPRYDVREITYVNGFGRIFEHGVSESISMADGPGAVVEVDIKAPIAKVWELVSDISMPAAFSEEFVGADWADGADGPAVGAKFIGRNTHPARDDWEVPCFVDVCDEEQRFGWVTSDPDNPGARWRFELERIAGSVRVRFIVKLGPGPSGITEVIKARPELEAKILHRRISEHRQNMQAVMDGLVSLATAET